MAEGGHPKGFKVTYGTRKVLVYNKTYAEFLKKCKDKFKLEEKSHVTFTLPEDDTEVDEDCFDDLPDRSDIHLHVSEQIGVQTVVSGSENVETDTENQSGNGDSRDDDYYNRYDTGSEEDYGDVSWFKWDDEESIKEHISKYGQNGLESLLKDSLEGWRRQPVNIAIIGQSGKGIESDQCS
ncbi:uncharacterized protein LOC123557943 [Mercenaria mercenaria]|uniref:uncharacterized protein LOC123557943 n=1 Tax=Mercenaria mercenaria TaxID=6596 RepID=UPI001E1D2C64|nr:uncharacterized protein LOC123557943 [Mercenaria mercenaria]